MMTEASPRHQIVGSVVAGFASTFLGHPLDTIKAHLQTNPNWKSSSDVLREIRWRGLFRGMLPPLANAIIMNSVMFSVFSQVHSTCNDPFVAGLISGFATAMVWTPTDYLKIQAQLHQQPVLSLLRRQSIVSLYRGHVINLIREGVFTMTYLGLYHWIRFPESSEVEQTTSLVEVALRSSFTGASAWVISYPFDTLKTLAQSSGRLGYWETFQSLPTSQLYKGCRTSTIRAILVTSSRMVAYEWVLSALQ